MVSTRDGYPPTLSIYSITKWIVCRIILNSRLLVNDINWNIDFWDTAGQEKFDRLHPSYYFGAHSCMLVFDVTRKITYAHLYAKIRSVLFLLP